MKRIPQLIVTTLVFLVPLYGQRVFVEPTIGKYAPDQYASKLRFGANAGINLPAGLQFYGGYSVWASSKTTASSDTSTGFKYFDADTRTTAALLGVRENYRLGESRYNIRIGIAYSYEMTATTTEQLRFTDFSFNYSAFGGVVFLETGLAIDTQNGGQLFLGIEYMMGEIPYASYAVQGMAGDKETINADREEYGLAPLTDGFVVDGFIFKISYAVTLGL